MPPSAAVRSRRLGRGLATVSLLAAVLVAVGPGASSGPVVDSVSDAVQARRGPAISLTAPKTAVVHRRIRLTGAVVVRPPHGSAKARTVKVAEGAQGRWHVVARVRTSRTGEFVLRIAAGTSVRTRTFRAEAPAVRGLSAVRTGPVRVKVEASGSGSPTGAPSPGDMIEPEALPADYVGGPPASDWAYIFDGGGRWNPCAVIRWSYNPAGQSYPDALADVARAYAKIAGVSGLQFQYVGRTTYRYLGPQSENSFPAGKTDEVVSWASQNEMPDLEGGVVGIGGASGVATDTPGADVDVEITRGHLTLDKANGFPLTPGFDGSGWGQVMLHEILHTVGLGHAEHENQLMYGTASEKNYRFGAGDIRGMKKIGVAPGSSGCL